MNETDVRDLFAAAVARPDVDRIDTAAVVRGGRRRRRVRVGAGVGTALAVIAVAGTVEYALLPHRTASPPVATASPSGAVTPSGDATPSGASVPSELAVACTPTGIRVSAPVVAATSAGVVLRVTSTMPKGAYLNHGSGGDELASRPETWTLSQAPGPLHLSCTYNGDQAPGWNATMTLTDPAPVLNATVTVTDPGGYWTPTTIADLGCRFGGIPAWVKQRPGTGATAEAAVADWLRQFPSRDAARDTAARARVGYRDAPTQTWIVSRDGKPTMTVTASVSGERPGYTVSPDQLCE